MPFPRVAGILLHPTSLPGVGIGDFGPDALRFVDWLADAGMRVWQVLPLGPTGYGNSPYQCFSAFAGNPMLVHVPGFTGRYDRQRVDFARVLPDKRAALDAWLDTMPYDDAVRAFVDAEAHWLVDYARFMALKGAHDGRAWTTWEHGAAHREAAALAAWDARLRPVIERTHKEQFVFAQQFAALRAACRARGIALMGDLPIYVAHDSADVWVHRAQFQLRDDGTPRVQAGVPPDYFSETGQLWGNPLYDWPRMQRDGFRWWIARMRAALAHFDMVRLDHFRGFEAYWEVPGDALTAVDGRWCPGPGLPFFEALTAALGPLPIVAEDLGLITPEVTALREACGFPGMAVLQFAFDTPDSTFLPHRHVRDSVVYTGTHDNDTAAGWWASVVAGDDGTGAEGTRALAQRYLETDGRDMPWTLIRTALASVADTALVPLQDVLALGSDARMNLPGRTDGNWAFRFAWDQLTPAQATRLRALVSTYGR
ncbi:MAG: 4-alpha-glucanotransferase [Gemmatimonadetes bacterium]|nr:4-alpha-glucanotransferase [Gemmatimonadota bacterium]